jgi:hypothetical protein
MILLEIRKKSFKRFTRWERAWSEIADFPTTSDIAGA